MLNEKNTDLTKNLLLGFIAVLSAAQTGNS